MLNILRYLWQNIQTEEMANEEKHVYEKQSLYILALTISYRAFGKPSIQEQ